MKPQWTTVFMVAEEHDVLRAALETNKFNFMNRKALEVGIEKEYCEVYIKADLHTNLRKLLAISEALGNEVIIVRDTHGSYAKSESSEIKLFECNSAGIYTSPSIELRRTRSSNKSIIIYRD